MAASSSSSPLLFLIAFLLFKVSRAESHSVHENFLQCFISQSFIPISQVLYTPSNSSYSSILKSTAQNPRFLTPTTPKPQLIVTPLTESHVQVVVSCSRKYGLQIRTRSGGHDYEGLSYVSNVPFVLVDLVNFRSVSVNVEDNSVWVQSGATLGEVYYRIAEKSRTFAIPAGLCPTVGVGGHISGGGYGTIMRKYGLAADNVIDAQMVDANGRFLNKASMGEDLFWAIRGGGGASFGIILSWKIKLVPVPPIVTVFRLNKTLEEEAIKLLHRWQFVAPKIHEDLFLRGVLDAPRSQSGERKATALFDSLFLGSAEELLPLMEEGFPELGLELKDCIQMSWIESTLYFYWFPLGESLDVLLKRTRNARFFKGKSDFVKKPIPEIGLEGLWKRLLDDIDAAQVIFTPYGGRMSKVSESELPFPHREGTLNMIHYLAAWDEQGIAASNKHISWIRRLYSYMAPYVSQFPRVAYVNYRDLDLGINQNGPTSYKEAKVWGPKYFKRNFERLVHVKTKVDPTNFFRNEQSIP
ncbi:berberine bridge enzyme-like 27 [Macadamia integrifolia]|uniref:berberine bridge enzyme-like 27 n=1 Tax=Macadamia integrifolia TaxID=60698 RepID=UPI001C527A95|nr:berberine bridge enzyme-like 27 [Macadamia integrifolia]